MRSIFKSGVSLMPSLVLLGTVLLLIGLFIIDLLFGNLSSNYYFHLFDLLVVVFLTWIWLRTFYAIENNTIICKAGPFFSRVDIGDIKKIELNKKLWSGFRPALSFNGMVIHYNKFDEIFISPKDLEGFISVLKRMNPTIKFINE